MRRFACLAALTAAALTTACAPRDAEAPPAPDTLLVPGQIALIEYAEGPRADWAGNQGPGRFTERLDDPGIAFGAFRVLAHTPDALVYDVSSGTCRISADGTAGCTDGSRGTWSIAVP